MTMKFISDLYRDPLSLQSKYISNEPFPHIVFDNFINEELLELVVDEFPDLSQLENRIQHNNQKELKLASSGSQDLSPAAKDLIGYLNSDQFLKYLQELTGVKETLISDPYLSGGGYHEVKRGGLLKVHADFNKHPALDLDRRLNLLLYLNKDWESEWGGNLELYHQDDLSAPVVTVPPVFNRCVVFTTTSFTYHGHPAGLKCPYSRSRRSIALYYFSTGRPSKEVTGKKHTTLFVETKDEKFKLDVRKLMHDLLPPILIRGVKKLLGK